MYEYNTRKYPSNFSLIGAYQFTRCLWSVEQNQQQHIYSILFPLLLGLLHSVTLNSMVVMLSLRLHCFSVCMSYSVNMHFLEISIFLLAIFSLRLMAKFTIVFYDRQSRRVNKNEYAFLINTIKVYADQNIPVCRNFELLLLFELTGNGKAIEVFCREISDVSSKGSKIIARTCRWFWSYYVCIRDLFTFISSFTWDIIETENVNHQRISI